MARAQDALRGAAPGVDARARLVAACDKLDNLSAIVADLETEGLATLERFSGKPRQIRWYYEEVIRGARRATCRRACAPSSTTASRCCAASCPKRRRSPDAPRSSSCSPPLLVLFFAALPALVDRALNRVAGPPPPAPSERARALFASLRVVDLHADSLLWQRDLARARGHGQVDVPRLLEGNVALQVFGIVTQSPLGQNFERNEAGRARRDHAARGARSAGRSPTWTSRLARAEHQAAKLDALAAGSAGRLTVIRTAADLQRVPRGARAGSGARRGAARHRGRAGARRHARAASIACSRRACA